MDEPPRAAVEEVAHGLSLRVEAEPALALAVGAHAIVGDEVAAMWCAGFSHRSAPPTGGLMVRLLAALQRRREPLSVIAGE